MLSENEKDPIFPETTRALAISYFKDTYVDTAGRMLILFTPKNNMTAQIMSVVVEILGLEEQNKVDLSGQAPTGVVRIDIISLQYVMELFQVHSPQNDTLLMLKSVHFRLVQIRHWNYWNEP